MSKNFKEESADEIVAFLRLGRDKEARLAPSTWTANPYGCRCCGTEFEAPKKGYASIETTVSGNALHRIAESLGLLGAYGYIDH
jgi:hypothetical protein